MNTYKIVVLFFLGLLVMGCSSDDDAQNDEINVENYDSKLRVESGEITGGHDGYSTFSQTYLDFGSEQVYEFSINFQDHIVLTESTILLAINMYSDNQILPGLVEGESYYFDDSWIAGGPKNTFGVGLTIWDESHENGVIYSDVIGGNIVFNEIGNNKIRALFNFEIRAPETGDIIKTKTSVIIAYPLE